MKIYSRYIITRLILSVITITFMLTGIAWLSQSLRFIELVVNHGLQMGDFMYLTLLIIPSLLWIILPIALLISIIIVYNRLYGDSELVILSSSGFSKWQVMSPAIFVGTGVILTLYLLALCIQPLANREYMDLKHKITTQNAAVFISDKSFLKPSKDITIYIAKKDGDGNLNGIFFSDKRDASNNIIMMAESGRMSTPPNSNIPRITLYEGTRHERKPNGTTTILRFKQYTLDLDINTHQKVTKRTRRRAKEMFIDELFVNNGDSKRYNLQMAEAHHRLSWPLFGIIFAVLMLLPFVTGDFSRHGKGRQIAIVSSTGITLLIIAFILRNSIKKSVVAIYGVYLLPIITLIIMLIYLRKR